MPRKDYGDPPRKTESIIDHLHRLCPNGTWRFDRAKRTWAHESGIVVHQSLDYAKANILWFDMGTGLAHRGESGWVWFANGEILLKRLTGNE
jgi:hypothetical protein